ncbi:Ycf53-like protein [Planktothrix serta PCC 8927]|uniref:Ycf53-like protein n=1 Tax=Planktothrix serta PCC 8927 TaxID=671068 RepID=A0A7Z9DVZ8_9CYAN|nr:GUN4 domain-containing protein [Planktothrix serta]VXD11483.1 Ycf53-like protein [Planktothrix serta PCC 8927]
MTDLTTSPQPDLISADELRSQLFAGSEKAQFQLLQTLTQGGETVWDVLMEFLLKQQSHPPNLVDGKVYQILYTAAPTSEKVSSFLQTHFPTGIVPLKSQTGIDYIPLQKLLAQQDFLEADKLSLQKLCELAGTSAAQRKWIYFSEIERLPITDLHTLDSLWKIHSEGKFGYSVQQELWLSVNKNWDKFWPKIGWRTGRNWTRYPQEFTWDLTAPKGHLPLSNQLRGVRVIEALLSHPAWSKS